MKSLKKSSKKQGVSASKPRRKPQTEPRRVARKRGARRPYIEAISEDEALATAYSYLPCTTTELDQIKCVCGSPDCKNDITFLGASCHPGAALSVVYTKPLHRLDLFCAICRRHVVGIAVAEEVRSDKVLVRPMQELVQ